MAQQNQMSNDAGYIRLNSDHKLKPTSFWNYAAKLATTSKLSHMQTSIAKTNLWFVAEHSFRGKVNNFMLIANTHVVEVDEEDADARREL